jgi:hypothetical protein
MTRARAVTPAKLGNAVNWAQTFRSQHGFSQAQAAANACRAMNLDHCWALVIQAMLNMSPLVAEAWAEEQFQAALDAASERLSNG